jgi:hypothetical protein
LVAVCVIGLGLIVFSRHELEQKTAAAATTTTTTQANATPPILSDHWQVALSVDICGKVDNLPKSADQTSGIITGGNGVVDIEPARAGKQAAQFEGSNATLGKFLTSEKVTLAADSLGLPKSVGKLAGTYANGRKCGTKPGRLQLLIWSTPSAATSFATTASPGVTYGNGQMYMLAFVPAGTSVPKPPGAKLVAAFVKSQAATTTTTTAKSTTTTTTKSGTTTTTTKAGNTTSSTTTTTTAPGSTTTTKPGSSTSTTG